MIGQQIGPVATVCMFGKDLQARSRGMTAVRQEAVNDRMMVRAAVRVAMSGGEGWREIERMSGNRKEGRWEEA